MPQINVPEQQILDTLGQLSPQGRREAIRRLLPGSKFLDQMIDRLRPHIEALVRARGLDWNCLSVEAREKLVDELLHESSVQLICQGGAAPHAGLGTCSELTSFAPSQE